MAGRRGYAVEQRLRLIDFLLQQYGHFNRAALVDYFGISVPQASADVSAYLQLASGNATYCGRRKAYVRTAGFVRVYP